MDKGSTARFTVLSQCIAALANLDDEMDRDSVLAALIAFYRWRPDMEIGDLVWELQHVIETLKATAAPELGVLLHMLRDTASAGAAASQISAPPGCSNQEILDAMSRAARVREQATPGGDHEDRR